MWTALVPLYGGIELTGRPDLENVRRLDLLPLPCINEMTRYGFALDKEWMAELSSKLTLDIDRLRREICNEIPPDKLQEFMDRSGLDDDDDAVDEDGVPKETLPMNVDSNIQLAELLFNVLGIGKGKQLKMTKGGKQISTGKKQMEQLALENPICRKVLNYREVFKLKTTYTEKLPRITVRHNQGTCLVCELQHTHDTDRIHTQILSTRTDTGRLASKSPNLQNIPARKAIGREVRKGFVASPGTELVGVDFSQMEMRMGGHYSEDANLKRIFELNLDVHTDTARRAFGLGPDDVPDKHTQRDPSKITNFMVFYGATALGLYDQLCVNFAEAGLAVPDWLTVDWCQGFIDKWFHELYPGIERYIVREQGKAARYGVTWTLCGRIRRVPELQSVHRRIIQAGLRQIGNTAIQGTCADVNKIGLAMAYDIIRDVRGRDIWCWPLMTIHDELIIEVEQGHGEWVKWLIEDAFEHVMDDVSTGESMCSVPIRADGKVMQRWTK